jgi:hypothetical protein
MVEEKPGGSSAGVYRVKMRLRRLYIGTMQGRPAVSNLDIQVLLCIMWI